MSYPKNGSRTQRRALLAEAMECRTLLSAAAAAAAADPDPFPLLVDINTTTKGADPTPMAELGGRVVFAAWNGRTGREAWITDDTLPAGARLLADLRPGADSSDPHDAAAVGDRVVFWAKDAAGADRLWSSDGTAGGELALVSPALTRPQNGSSAKIIALDGLAFFWGFDGTSTGIFSTDGTPEGTGFVAPAPSVTDLAVFHGAVVFGLAGGAIVRINPADHSTTPLTPDSVQGRGPFVALGDTLMFSGYAGGATDPWMTDGTPAGTRMAVDVTTTTDARLAQAARLGNGRIVLTTAAGQGYALDASGGAAVALFNDGGGLAAVGGLALFGAPAPLTSGATALWATDGTAAGTRVVKEYRPRPGTTDNAPRPGLLTAVGGGSRVVFTADDGVSGTEPWVTDGSAAGTVPLRDVWPGGIGSSPASGYFVAGTSVYRAATPSFFVAADGRAYFAADDGSSGTELWRTDGTPAGTARAADANDATRDGVYADANFSGTYRDPEDGVPLNGRTYFTADDGVHGLELWSTDGTAGGAAMVADLVPGSAGGAPLGLLVADGALYFVAYYKDVFGDYVRGVYRTDGTAAGTVALVPTDTARQYTVHGIGNERVLLRFRGKVAFLARSIYTNGGGGTRLWLTDGTPDGTVGTGTAISTSTADPARLTVSGDYLFFSWNPTTSGRDSLCAYDGTDWRVIASHVDPGRLTDFDGELFYSGASGLYVARPADGGLGALSNRKLGLDGCYAIARAGDAVYISGYTNQPSLRYGLWRADAAGALTEVLTTPAGTFPPVFMGFAGGRVWFFSDDGRTGREPWVSDGTPAGTHAVADLNPGPAASLPSRSRFVQLADGYVYFEATTAATGTELFRTDGTAAGTTLVADFVPGPAGSLPGPVLAAPDGSVYYAPADPGYGREWRRVGGPDAVAPTVAAVSVAGSAWRPSFLNDLTSRYLGSPARGLSLDAAAGGRRSVPWTGLDRVSVRFGEAVRVGPDSLRVSGSRKSAYVVKAFSYDPATFTATWTLAAPVGADRLRLSFAAGAVTDGAGNALAATTFPLDVLPGDANGDGRVTAVDELDIRARVGRTAAAPGAGRSGYSPFADLNGSGAIDVIDYALARMRLMSALPPATTAPFSAQPVTAVARLRDDGVLA